MDALGYAVSAFRGSEGPFVAITGGVVLLCAAAAIYGIWANFIPTAEFMEWNEIAALGLAAICGLCAVYLVMTLVEAPLFKHYAAAGLFSAFAGYMSVSDGIPAWLGHATAHRGTVVFTVSSTSIGGKGCNGALVVTNPVYVDQRLCNHDFEGRRPQVGDRIAFTGAVSEFGLSYEHFAIVR
jgi:hypothetical protein